jgi:hypothetical protein
MALRSGWSVGSIGVWRAIFLPRGEPFGWRAANIGSPFCLNNQQPYFTDFLEQRKYPNNTARHAFFGWFQVSQSSD